MADHKLTLRRGDCFDLALIYTANGVPVDLTGATVELAIRNLVVVGEIDVPTGRIDFHLTAEQTFRHLGAPGRYQVRVVDAADCVTTLVAGDLLILPTIFQVAL